MYDFFVQTDLDEEYQDADLKIHAKVRNYGAAAGTLLVARGLGPGLPASDLNSVHGVQIERIWLE